MTSIERNSLCVPCQGIFRLKPGNPAVALGKNYEIKLSDNVVLDKAKHHMTFEEFESCGKEKCHLCLLLLGQVPPEYRKLLRDLTPENGIMGLQCATRELASTIDLMVWYPFSARVRVSQPKPGFMITLHLYPEDVEETIKTKTPVKVESFYTGADSSLTTALNWIRTCVNNHSGCTPQNQLVKVFPARLIDVGSASDYSDIRLCLTTKIEGDIVYAALSHRWGKQQPTTLTTSVQDLFETSIEWVSLPKTFQHAIKLVRKSREEFNVRFIWIDSLCIVQDSLEDWRQESAKMGHVYKNALCVLAATAGSDGSSGLFFERNPLSLCPITLQTEWEGWPKRSYICKNNRPFDTDIAASSLLDRAWVVQERTLARRVIHFTAQQIYWECATVDASETYPDGLHHFTNPIEKDWSPLDFKYKRKRGKYYDPNKSDRDIYNIWSHVLFHYSKAKLTKPSDKLIAISGIAREMQSHLEGKDTYVAGIWTKDLVHNLLWETLGSPHSSQQTEYRAPTWSWASLDAPLQLLSSIRGESDTSLVTIHSLVATPAGDDHFSNVTSGSLQITGYLVKVLLTPSKLRGHSVVFQLYSNSSGISPIGTVGTDIDLRLSNLNHDIAWCMPFISRSDSDSSNNDNDNDKGPSSNNETSSPLNPLLNPPQASKLIGLVIKPTLRVNGEYERCGHFVVVNGREKNYEVFMRAAKNERIWERGYEKYESESGKCTVTIV